MWNVEVVQKRKSSYSDVMLEEKLVGSFMKVNDAISFERYVISNFENATVTITCTNTNVERKENE